jgi:hypothetical protein
MSNIISDFNTENDPNNVSTVELPDKAAKTTPQQAEVTTAVTEQRDQYGNLPTVVRNTLQDYTPIPEATKKEHVPLGNFASPAVGVTYPTPQMDLNSYLPTEEEFDKQLTEEHQNRVDWLSAQVGNYTPSTALDITAGGLEYRMDTPGIGLSVPDNLYWKENEERAAQQAAYEAQVVQEQARLEQQGYDIQPQTNVVSQQGGFNSGGTAQQGWTIGGLWNDIQGAFNLAGRVVQSTAEGAIGRPIQNPLDIAEAVVRSNPIVIVPEFGVAAVQGKQQQYLDKYKTSFSNNFVKKPLTQNETNLLAGGISQKGPVNLSRGQFGEQGSGVLGAVNYGLDNFLGGNALIRAPLANVKRNIDNARNGRPQQWDEGFGVIAALKGQSYSALADSNDNPDTSFVGKDKHGAEFWIRAGGGFLYDAVTDLSPLAVIKQGIKKGGKLALKQSIKNVPASSVRQMVDAGDVVVEVTKKGGQQDVKTVPLAGVLSPEKRQAFEKQGLVVVGAKQVKGPSPKKLTQQATREAKRVAKGKKPKQAKTPDIQYEFITMKRSELIEKSVNTLTPTTGDVLNKVVTTPTQAPVLRPGKSATEILDGYRVPVDPKTGKKIYPLGADGKPLDTAEKLQAARTAKIKAVVDVNPLLSEVVYGPKTRRASQSAAQERLTELDLPAVSDTPKARDVEVLPPKVEPTRTPIADVGGQVGDTTVRSAYTELPPVVRAVKEATLQPELPPTFKQQLLGPGAAENILKQAEADGTIRVEPDGLIKDLDNPRNSPDIEAAQKELIRLRIEQNRLKDTPNFDLVGQPGTKLGNQVAELQSRIDSVRSTITGGHTRKEFYDTLTSDELDRVIPVIPESLSNPLPNTPSSLFSRLKTEGRVFLPGKFVERSVDDLSSLAEYLGHKSPGVKLTAEGISELRQMYGMVYSRVGEPINKKAIRQYLEGGVGRIETKAVTATNPVRETVLTRRSNNLTVLDGGGITTTRTTKYSDDAGLTTIFQKPEEQELFRNRREYNEALAEFREEVPNTKVIPLRKDGSDNILTIDRSGDRRKYQYATTGEAAPRRSTPRGLSIVEQLDELTQQKDELLTDLGNPNLNQAELQSKYDELALSKQLLEELDPQEARKVQKYMKSLPDTPETPETERLARLVYEGEQTVADTTQRIRDINLELEALREQLDETNDLLKSEPPIEPQPLDVGTYDTGLVSEKVFGQNRVINELLKQDRPLAELGDFVRQREYWHGSSFEDALMYGPESVNPTRNPLGLGHYLYTDGRIAEEAARAVLPDNHIDAGLTPNENGVVQRVSTPDVRNPLDATQIPPEEVTQAFSYAIRESFEPNEVRKVENAWLVGTEEKPLTHYWDSLSEVWAKKFTNEPIPEDKFRAFEVAVSNNLLRLGYDSVYHPNMLVLLDNSLVDVIDELVELPTSSLTQKLLSRVNVTSLWESTTGSRTAKVHKLDAEIAVGEGLIDDLMEQLDVALRDNDVALEQLMRNEEELTAMLESDKVAKTLAAQEEAAEQVVKDTDTLLKQNDEHPSCL